MLLFNLVSLPPFHAVWIGDWNLKQPARYFIAAQTRGEFRDVIGLPVIDEFATFSGAILFGPASVLGKLYNVGISLGHWRDPEMSIDTGWPPLAVGIGESDTEIKPKWEQDLLTAVQSFVRTDEIPQNLASTRIENFVLQYMTFGQAAVFATDAPLLPRQLRRLCQTRSSPCVIAFSTANMLTRQKEATPLSVKALSEAKLSSILNAANSIQ